MGNRRFLAALDDVRLLVPVDAVSIGAVPAGESGGLELDVFVEPNVLPDVIFVGSAFGVESDVDFTLRRVT